MSTVMNLNIAENLAYGDVEMDRLYYGSDLLWETPGPPPEVILWLRGDDFSDSSGNGRVPLNLGNIGVSINNSLFKYGSGSFDIPSADAWLAYDDVELIFGFDIDFTVEFWLNKTSYANDGYWQVTNSTTPGANLLCIKDVEVRKGSNNGIIPYVNPPINQWNHFALCRKNDTLELFINGVSQGTSPEAVSISQYWIFGAYFASAFGANGNFDSIRVTKYQARYTADFDPDTDTGLAY